MYLQRLVADDKSGFNYDYMGSAEYEFGATRKTRSKIAYYFARGNISAKRISFVERMWNGSRLKPVDTVIIGRKDYISSLDDELVIKISKEAFRTQSTDIIGWMNVDPYREAEPFVIVRADLPDVQKRIDMFFGDFIKAAKAELKAEEDNKIRS
jgi:hypothetical protein